MLKFKSRAMVVTTYIFGWFWLSFAGAMGTDTNLISEAGYFMQSINPERINATIRDLPDCGICSFDTSLYKDGAILDAVCPQNARYREESFRCDRYQCSDNKYKYVKIHLSWGSCIDEAIDSACPASTCQ